MAALADVAATPLGLWLLRTVYTVPGADPAELTDPARFPTPVALRAHLFDHLIPALINTSEPNSNRPEHLQPRRRHDPDQVHRWLGYLAHHLTHQPNPASGLGTRNFAWWRLAATTHAIAANTALTSTLAAALPARLTGLATRLVIGLTVGRVIESTLWSWARDVPGYADLRIRQRSAEFVRILTPGLAGGLVFGLAAGLTTGLMFGLTNGQHRAWWVYLVVTWRLARAGLLPRRLMPFLDDCHRLGLLRAVGPFYQFRHAELHDHLAATYRPTT